MLRLGPRLGLVLVEPGPVQRLCELLGEGLQEVPVGRLDRHRGAEAQHQRALRALHAHDRQRDQVRRPVRDSGGRHGGRRVQNAIGGGVPELPGLLSGMHEHQRRAIRAQDPLDLRHEALRDVLSAQRIEERARQPLQPQQPLVGAGLTGVTHRPQYASAVP